MSKRNWFSPRQLPLASIEFEKEVKSIFFGHELSAEEFAAQFLFKSHDDCVWSLTPYLCNRYRDKDLEEFASHLRAVASDESILDRVRKKHLSADKYDEMVELDSTIPAYAKDYSDEDDDEDASVDIAKLRKAYFPNCEFPEELVWLAFYQNKYDGFVGNGVDLRDDEDLTAYRIEDGGKLFVFAVEGDGSPIAIWNAGNNKFPVVYMGMEDPEFCFVVAEDMREFLAILTLPLIDIGNLSCDWFWKDPSEWDDVSKDLKKFRRKVKRKFGVLKPANVQSRIKNLQSKYDEFNPWCKEIMFEVKED